MRSIQTRHMFPLSAVKPLERLETYRSRCLAATKAALQGGGRRRTCSPVTSGLLESFGEVGGLEYLRCRDTGSLFLGTVGRPAAWAGVLREVNRERHAPAGFYSGLEQSRSENVYTPKLEWIHNTLLLQGIRQPRLMEVVTPPSDFSGLLTGSGLIRDVAIADEMELREEAAAAEDKPVDVAVLLESLDRVDDPTSLLRAVAARLVGGGLVFITALVCSGFDIAVLGCRSLYLYPPDRTNCFSLGGLEDLISRAGFTLLEVSTPGVLDVEIVDAHVRHDPSISLSAFEQQLLQAPAEARSTFQLFLQQQGLSSFARIVGRKTT